MKKYSSIKTIGYILLFVLHIFTLLYFYRQNRLDKLKNNSFTTYGIVEKLKPNSPKGTITREDVVYFYFLKNDTVFHKISNLSEYEIERLGIKINDCFEVKVVKSDYEIFDIDFKKRKDTMIDKRKFKTQIYNSIIHRNIIE